MYIPDHFEFVETPPALVDLCLDDSVSNRNQLFDTYARELSFPDYFGRNWDAFVDCLSDLSWIDQDVVVVMHRAIPALPEPEQRTYVTCLQDVVARWREGERPRVRIFFREDDRSRIDRLFAEG